MKKFILSLLLFITITGCQDEYYTENYLEKYGEYLKYAFGEYKVILNEKVVADDGPLPINKVTFMEYEIEYTNIDGKVETFYFRNNSEDDFKFGIVKQLSTFLEPKITDQFFSNINQEENYISLFIDSNNNEYGDDLVAPETGINFIDFQIKDLNKFNLKMSFSLFSTYPDSKLDKLENVRNKFLISINDLYKYTRNKNIEASVNNTIPGEEFDYYKGIDIKYDDKTDSFIFVERNVENNN